LDEVHICRKEFIMHKRSVVAILGIAATVAATTSVAAKGPYGTMGSSDAASIINTYYSTHSSTLGYASPTTLYFGMQNTGCTYSACSGFFENFSNGASVYTWAGNDLYTFTVAGKIRDAYNSYGTSPNFAADSMLGYPITEAVSTYSSSGNSTGLVQGFEGADIYLKNGAAHAFEIHGGVETKWWMIGETRSALGWPTSNVGSYQVLGYGTDPWYQRSLFEHGHIMWNTNSSAGWQGGAWPVFTESRNQTGTPITMILATSNHGVVGGSGQYTLTPYADVTINLTGFPANTKVEFFHNNDFVSSGSSNAWAYTDPYGNVTATIHYTASDCGYYPPPGSVCIVTIEARSKADSTKTAPTDPYTHFAAAGINL
jgi:hypothetical protein